MESIGEYLKREREFRNISLEEISRKTKIRAKILRGLEEDRLDFFDSPVFVKGYLKAYAGYVGLNPNDVVLRYEASLKEDDTSPPPKKSFEDTPGQWSIKYIVLPVSILVLIGVLLFLVLKGPMRIKTNQEPQEIAKPPISAISEVASEKPSPTIAEETPLPPPSFRKPSMVISPPVHPSRQPMPIVPEAASGIELKLTALENTWIEIQIDKTPAREIFLRPGEVISRRGQENIEMKVGNAGGLKILHNGKDLGQLGKSGKVVYLSISPGDVKVRGSSGLIRQEQ